MPEMEPIISVSGLRGIIGRSLTPLIAAQYVAAFAATLPKGGLIVTRDGRASGEMLAEIVCGTLQATGHEPLYGNVAATPTTGVLVRQHRAVGGIQISASHNPSQYNGLKLFGKEGRVISATAGTSVLQNHRQRCFAWVTHDGLAARQQLSETLNHHLALVLGQVDVDLIRQKRFRVVLDSNHGAGSILGRTLLTELGCQTTILGETPDGEFAHPPEPTAENLAEVSRQIGTLDADVGFGQDPDADRLAIIDQNGRYLGEEMTLAICVDHVLSKRPGPIVINCSTSRMSEDLANRHGVRLYRSKVGEANVTEMMVAKNAVFGGEGNGGPIDPQVGYVRDSFVGMALVLECMAQSGRTIAAVADRLPQYAMFKSKVELPADAVAGGLASLTRHFAEARIDQQDGLRLDWPGKWLLVRASNTEPIVRLVAESSAPAESRSLCEQAAQVLMGQRA